MSDQSLTLPATLNPPGNLFHLFHPDDDDFGERMFDLYRRRAARLTELGWKFAHNQGPRGHWFEASSPQGKCAMGAMMPTKEQALLKIIMHAASIEFDTGR